MLRLHLSRPLSRRLIAFGAGVMLLAAYPASAFGHAAFLDSNPAPGTRLSSGPAQVTLGFSEPLDENLSSANLIDVTSGATIPTESSVTGPRQLVLQPRTRLQKGAYRVDWHTVSTLDGHALEGSLGFGVRVTPGFSEGSIQQSPLARDGWLRILLRGSMYALLFFFAGGVINAALLAPRRRPQEWLLPPALAASLEQSGVDPVTAAERPWNRTLGAGWLALAAAVAVAVAEAANASSGLSLSGLSDFLLSNGAGLARVAAVAALGLAVLFATGLPRASAAWLAVTFGAIAFSGHANSADPRALALTTDWIHLVAGAVWVGGIAQLAVTWLPLIKRLGQEARLTVIRAVLERFGRVALPAFLVVIVSGLANALIQLGRVPALWETAYGRVLAVKIALVGLIALASYAHALRLRPRLLAANPHPPAKLERRHWRLLSAEPWLGLGVVFAVAALVAFPLPPRQLNKADEAQAATPCEPWCPLPTARAHELQVATHAGPNITAFWLQRKDNGLVGTIRLLNLDTRPVSAAVDVGGQGQQACSGTTGCWEISGIPSRGRLTATISDASGNHQVSVPTAWNERRTTKARALLARAQRTMRHLATVQMKESVTSGLGQTVHTHYRFAAPDRMEYRTQSGAHLIAIKKRSWESVQGGPFERGRFGGIDGVQFAQFFRWTVYGRSVRWLDANVRVVHLALFDPATPIWYRLTIDRATDRVLGENMITGGHFMTRRWFAFNRPPRIHPPR
jgi:copper transport protein